MSYIMKKHTHFYHLALLSSSLLLLLVASCSEKKTPVPTVTPPGSTTTVTTTKSSAKDLLTFAFNGLSPAVAGTINATAKTISATVAAGTDLTKLVPTLTVSPKATVSPASVVAQDFSKAVTYTVTAEDGSTQAYVATVTVEKTVVLGTFSEIVQKAVPLDVIEKIKGSGFPLFGGTAPPNVVGTYKMADCIISEASDKTLVSRKIADITYNFSGYSSTQQSVTERLKQTGGDNGSASSVFYVSGSGNGFSLFRNFTTNAGVKFYEVFRDANKIK